MTESEKYWNDLVNVCLRILKDKHEMEAVSIIRNSELLIRTDGIFDYYTVDLSFQLQYEDYMKIKQKKDYYEYLLFSTIKELNDEQGQDDLTSVHIVLKVEPYIDWDAIAPYRKDAVIKLVRDEKTILLDVSTGEVHYKNNDIEKKYRDIHSTIGSLIDKVGFDYPNKSETLDEWWCVIKQYSTYAERRVYIDKLYSELLEILNKSEETSTNISFYNIEDKNDTIKMAVKDAELFISKGDYDSAVDRVHTAFHGYLRQLLEEHDKKSYEKDSLPSLYNKLHDYYSSAIEPKEVGTRIKEILRSANGMINAVNEIRNNNTLSHPNVILIRKREAQLVIRLISVLIDYINEVEKDLLHEYQ